MTSKRPHVSQLEANLSQHDLQELPRETCLSKEREVRLIEKILQRELVHVKETFQLPARENKIDKLSASVRK